MRQSTALPTRLPGLLLVALLSVVPALVPGPASGALGEPDPEGEWPLLPAPAVVGAFDPPADPWGPGHRGVDLAGSPGQPVRAALPGRIAWAGTLAGRGVVVVDHGDTRTTYEPVATTVSVGDGVAAGDRIGLLQVVGSHCFPRACLHWGWLRGEAYLDPLLLVEAGPVRLLPLWRDEPVTLARGPDASPTVALSWAGWQPQVRLSGVPAGRPVAGGPW